MYLFSLDAKLDAELEAELEADLNIETVTEKSKNAFKTKQGITLHENANLKKVKDNEWEISDKWENQIYIYEIKKESGNLKIYKGRISFWDKVKALMDKIRDKVKALRDEIEAAMKALVVSFLIIFGILTLKHAFPEHCDVLLYDNLMVGLLMTILFLVIALYTINMFPRRQETKGKKAPVTDLKENFTHIIALIITIPLIVVTCVLLVGGNHSEELTFISGLLGVIIGYYFGQRGVESAERQRDDAKIEVKKTQNEQKSTKEEMEEAKRGKSEGKKANITLGERTDDLAKELDRSKKKEAWGSFKEAVKTKNKDSFEGIGNIDRYWPWEKPEGDWNPKEKELIKKFDEVWDLHTINQSDLEEVYEKPPRLNGEI